MKTRAKRRGPSPYRCDRCGRQYSSRGWLDRHRRGGCARASSRGTDRYGCVVQPREQIAQVKGDAPIRDDDPRVVDLLERVDARALDYLRHMTGRRGPEQHDHDRNYAAVAEGDLPMCEEMRVLGLVTRREQPTPLCPYPIFHATELGLAVARASLPKARAWIVTVFNGERESEEVVYALSRARARCQVVESLRDAWSCTFRVALGAITSVRVRDPMRARRPRVATPGGGA